MIKIKKAYALTLVVLNLLASSSVAIADTSTDTMPSQGDYILLGNNAFNIRDCFSKDAAKINEVKSAYDEAAKSNAKVYYKVTGTNEDSISKLDPVSSDSKLDKSDMDNLLSQPITYNGKPYNIDKSSIVNNLKQPVEKVEVFKSLTPGKENIVVTLYNTNPENYDVVLGDVKLNYDATAKEFTGDVLENDADAAQLDYSKIRVIDKTYRINNVSVFESLAPGKKNIVVTLSNVDSAYYDVIVGGVKLTYNKDTKEFIGEVLEKDANAAQLDYSNIKVIAVPQIIKSVSVFNSLTPGKKNVVVTLNKTDAENYDVIVGGVRLSYDESSKEFTGEVPENCADEFKNNYNEATVLYVVRNIEVFNSLAPGWKNVAIMLNKLDPEKYAVTLGGVELAYDPDKKEFSGEVPEEYAYEAKADYTKVSVMSIAKRIKTIDVFSSLIPGKKNIVVTLNCTNPENYDVTVGGVKLTYNSSTNEFIGEVSESNADLAKKDYSNIIISKK